MTHVTDTMGVAIITERSETPLPAGIPEITMGKTGRDIMTRDPAIARAERSKMETSGLESWPPCKQLRQISTRSASFA